MGIDEGAGLPAELRGEAPAVEPTVEVDERLRVPPEAAVTVVSHDRRAPATTEDDGRTEGSYEALARAEAAADRAHLTPAELRVAPLVEPTVEVDEGMHVPPEAAVIPVTPHER